MFHNGKSLSMAGLLLFFTFLLSFIPIFAQDLVTDRPDQTESAVVVPKAAFQLETGWVFSREGELRAAIHRHQFPSTLLRIGLTPRFELRLGLEGWLWERAAGGTRRGFGDLTVGGKVLLWSESDGLPQLALVVTAAVPAGQDGFSRERIDPELRVALSHTLSKRLSFGYNVALARVTEAENSDRPEVTTEFLYTASLGIEVTSRLGLFVESYGGAPVNRGGPPAHAVDTGLTLLIAPALQLDASAGVGLSDAAEDWIMGLGLSLRLPR
jgi:hypothetical protein